MKELKNKIMILLSELLSEYEFERKKKYNTFIRRLDSNIIQNIEFGFSHGEKGTIYLNPWIGVVYRDVYKIELSLRNIEPSLPDYVGPMIGSPIGYLMPEKSYREWKFMKDEDVVAEVNKMASAIMNYGFPYLEKLSNRDELIYSLEIGKHAGSREFLLPIFHYLNGNNKRALECADDFIRKFSVQTSQEEHEIIKMLGGVNEEVHIVNNGLKSYLEFVENLKLLIEQQEHL